LANYAQPKVPVPKIMTEPKITERKPNQEFLEELEAIAGGSDSAKLKSLAKMVAQELDNRAQLRAIGSARSANTRDSARIARTVELMNKLDGEPEPYYPADVMTAPDSHGCDNAGPVPGYHPIHAPQFTHSPAPAAPVAFDLDPTDDSDLPPLQPIIPPSAHSLGQPAKSPIYGKSLFISSPTLNGFKAEFVISLIQTLNYCTQTGTPIGFAPHSGNSFLQAARNVGVREFLKGNATHMLMVDDDIGWDPKDLFKMLASDYDFIAGAVPLRQMNWESLNHAVGTLGLKDGLDRFTTKYNVNIFLDGKVTNTVNISRDTGAMEVEFAGTAFLLVSRAALLKMISECKDLRWYYDAQTNEKTYDLFDPIIDNKTVMNGEDVSFCRRWKSIGGKIHTYPRFKFSHTGVVTLSGCFMDALAPAHDMQKAVE
jgi:hypothetical protein